MQHNMKLLELPFKHISKGVKTLELRLYDRKRKALKLGDTIRFSKLPNLTETVIVKITGLWLKANLSYSKFQPIPS
jgi:ASC-1-like (ASCH) protein